MRFTTGSKKPTPTVALLKNLRWIPDLNLNQPHQCPFAAPSFYFLLLNLKDLKPVGTDQPKAVALTLENKPKNRYNNVLPCELTELLQSTSFAAAPLIRRPSFCRPPFSLHSPCLSPQMTLPEWNSQLSMAVHMMTTSMLTTFRCVLTLLRAALSHCFIITKYNNCFSCCFPSSSFSKFKCHLQHRCLRPSWGELMAVLFYLAGLQLQEGVHSSSGSPALYGQRFLENDLGEECEDSGHADTLQRARTSERQHKHISTTELFHVWTQNVVSGQMWAVLGLWHEALWKHQCDSSFWHTTGRLDHQGLWY